MMTILAHMAMNKGKQKQNELGQMKLGGGKIVEKGSGHGRQRWPANKSLQNRHCRQTQPADSPLGSGLKQTATDGRPRSETTAAADDVGLPCR